MPERWRSLADSRSEVRWTATTAIDELIDGYEAIRNAHLSGCVFCEPVSGLVLAESDNFRLIADPVPIVEGHVLISPRQHLGCLGEVQADLLDELGAMRTYVTALLEGAYGHVSWFEHGRAGTCMHHGKEERLCHHCHLHAAPFRVGLRRALERRFRVMEIDGETRFNELYDSYGHYLYTRDVQGEELFIPVDSDLEPHYLRTVIAERIGEPHRADWQAFDGRSLLVRGLEAMTRQASALASEPATPMNPKLMGAAQSVA